MKKMMLLGALLLSAAAGYAQESRQDVSISGTYFFAPEIHGAGGLVLNTTTTLGLLASYRFMLTPRSALEVNYGFSQEGYKYTINGNQYRIHARAQEMSGAYVYNMNFRRYNPFVEAGPGAIIFTPITDASSTLKGGKQNINIGAVFGGGVAYELSPSFDIRAEYRGFLVKTPDFGFNTTLNLGVKRYEVVSTPTIGVAYHF
jgi:outer membrane immunogenic protein